MLSTQRANARNTGMELLDTPLANKGTAFTLGERSTLGLHGLLPPVVETLEQQCVRAYEAYCLKPNDLERHIYLRALQDTNEVLFYRLLLDHIQEMVPIVYTPTVAQICQQFSHIYRRPRGLFISYPLRNSIPQLLRNRPNQEVDVIVVTDGERVLGIGDQGVGGLAISIGKLSLYTLIGGMHPSRTLPIVLDAGTNNQERLRDPEYLGWHHERVTGQAYYDFVEHFVRAVKKELPHTLLQWEDFAAPHARPILDHYRDRLLTFNDDIQGTAAVALGTVLSAVHVTARPLREQHLVLLGAGSAGLGVADYLRRALIADGLSEEDARSRFWLLNSRGLLHSGRDDLTPQQRPYAQPSERIAGWRGTNLSDVIENVPATILLGLSTRAGAFTESIVKIMAAKVDRPVILPLSNPTDRAEARASDLIRWTDGRALVATGSPSMAVEYGGRTYPIAQCNNVFVFPAVGLGVVASQAQRVTDSMMMAAGRALGNLSPARRHAQACLLPSVADLRSIAADVALEVAAEAQRCELTPSIRSRDELWSRIQSTQWFPAY